MKRALTAASSSVVRSINIRRDIGSSYLMSDLQAAYLWAQLEAADRINQQRLALWQNYYDALAPLAKAGRIELPSIPDGCVQNAHMFYIKLRDIDDRSALINFLKEAEIMAVFHYIPLHGCPAEHFGEFHGEDRYTTKEASACCACRCSTTCRPSISVR